MSDWKNVQYKNGKYRTSEGGGGGGSSTFAGLDDVNFSDLQNGQVPKYNSTTQKWENADESGGGGTVTDVTVDGTSVVNQQGVAEITMPTPPTIPVQDVEVDGVSVVNAQGVAEITMPTPPTPNYPVTDVKVNGTSVVDNNKEAQIKSYKEVTQSEYNALPASKTSDDILYCIKDAGGADGFPPLIYSDEEREVGVWRDGKPLYQKTYHLASPLSVPTNSWTDTGISNTGIQKIIFGFGNDEFDNGGVLQSNSFMYLSFAVNAQNYVRVLNSRNATITLNYITLLYTKITDTAGSGTWTTQGTPTHHYSTTEHVVGTWIDGKPIYEKTIEVTSYTVNTNIYVPHGISNIDALINMNGRCKRNGTYIALPFVFTKASGIYDWSIDIYDCTDSSFILFVGSNNSTNLTDIYVTLQYTKTTD